MAPSDTYLTRKTFFWGATAGAGPYSTAGAWAGDGTEDDSGAAFGGGTASGADGFCAKTAADARNSNIARSGPYEVILRRKFLAPLLTIWMASRRGASHRPVVAGVVPAGILLPL